MPNPSPYKARLGKKLRGKPGTLADIKAVLWYAVKRAQGELERSANAETTLKAVHAVSQCAGQYAKLLEIGEHEARIAALEAAFGVLQR